MNSLLSDLRFAARTLLRNKLSTAVAILCLAIGIGSTANVFTIVEGSLIRPLPFGEPERVVAINGMKLRLGNDRRSMSAPDLLDLRAETRAFETIAPFTRRDFNVSAGDRPEHVPGVRGSWNLEQVLGVHPMLGRWFTAQEDRPGAPHVAVIGYDLWRTHYDADPRVIGSVIRVNGEPHTVVGVMPRRFAFPEWAEIWTPLAMDPLTSNRGDHELNAVALLARGATLASATRIAGDAMARLAIQYPASNEGYGASVTTIRDYFIPTGVQSMMWMMLAAGLFVLLIACANVANLFLARIAARERELAVRTALGASRMRIVRQLLTESMLIAGISGALGLALAVWGTRAMMAIVPVTPPYYYNFDLDWRIATFLVAVSGFTALAFGTLPALRGTRTLQSTLREGGRGGSGGQSRPRMRNALVIAELATSMVLVFGAALLIKSFLFLQHVDAGYRPERVFTAQVRLAGSRYAGADARVRAVQEIQRRVASIPGVQAASIADELPSSDDWTDGPILVEGSAVKPTEAPVALFLSITADHLATLGIPLRGGRTFSRQEIEDSATHTIILNETAARTLFPGADAIDQLVRVGEDHLAHAYRVVGVAADVKELFQIGGVVQRPRIQAYLPYANVPHTGLFISARTAGDPAALASAVREQVASLDPDLPLFEEESMPHYLERVVWLPKFYSQTFGAFAMIALALASAGVFGVMAYTVTQRRRELGIRIALGARPEDAHRLVLGTGMRLAVWGVLIGGVLSVLVARALASLLFGVSTSDPAVFIAVALLLTGTALLASWIPARRATRVDPMVVLREE